MNEILVFKGEASVEGLVEKIQSQSSIAYVAQLQSATIDDHFKQMIAEYSTVKAGLDFEDLYPTKSILVSTNWNKNDDVFDRFEVWQARHTPINKPTNLEHDEKQLVGHITDNWAIDTKGTIIPDSTIAANLPDEYHLCNAAVIYRQWEDPELVSRTDKLISQIEAGDKFVSMECLFAGFDYAIVGPDGKSYTVARNNESSFLTKHLKAYGGTGEFEGHKVGRLLRQLLFSGKGYVDHPANENSVIFNDATKFEFSKSSQENPFKRNSGVYIDNEIVKSQEINDMADNADILKNQLDELKATLAEVKSSNKDLQDKLAKADVDKYENQVADLTTQLEAAKKDMDDEKKKSDESKSALEDLEAKFKESEEARAELEVKFAEVEAAKTKADRVSLLVDGGISRESAEEKVEVFAGLDEDQFKVLADELISAAKSKTASSDYDSVSDDDSSDASDDDASQDDADANADSDVLDDADANDDDIDGAVGSDEGGEAADTRLALANFLRARRGLTSDDSEDNKGDK
jgi:predicted  nucleic acid-binding Zn-ribbon protein